MYKILMFLLGFFLCHNIVWVFKGSSASYIYVETFIATILLFKNRRHIKHEIASTNRFLKLYVAYALVLFPFSLLYFMDTSKYMSPINSMVFLSFPIVMFLCIKVCRNDLPIIMKGFFIGFICNLAYSIVCYFLLQRGISWRILDWFRLENSNAFFYKDYYRASGFFMECSIYMCFLATTTSLMLYNIRNHYLKISLVFLIILFAGISFSGNIINIFLCLLLYFTLVDKQTWSYSMFVKLIVPITLICLIFSTKIGMMLDDMDFFNLLDQSIHDIDISDESNVSNQTRLESFMSAIDLIVYNPFGYGNGCSSPLLEVKLHMKGWGVLSFLFKTLIEVGWIGLFLYIMIFVSFVKRLMRMDNQRKCIAISLICMFVAQSASGIGWMSFCVFVLALADIATKNPECDILAISKSCH